MLGNTADPGAIGRGSIRTIIQPVIAEIHHSRMQLVMLIDAN